MEIFLCHREDIILKHRVARDRVMTLHDLVTKFEMGGNKTLAWRNDKRLSLQLPAICALVDALEAAHHKHILHIFKLNKLLATKE